MDSDVAPVAAQLELVASPRKGVDVAEVPKSTSPVASVNGLIFFSSDSTERSLGNTRSRRRYVYCSSGLTCGTVQRRAASAVGREGPSRQSAFNAADSSQSRLFVGLNGTTRAPS